MEWIWLLHDDCEPVPDALEQLLGAASRNRSTAVLGPKVMDLADRRVLREAGLTMDRAGRRVTGIEPGEIDQGQHDGNRPVVAVSSAGMLIRRDVWDQVGGFDPNLPLMRDDLDFCWRVHAAGYDIRVITDAVVYHRDMSARQLRKAPAAGGHPRLFDRRGTLYLFAVNVPFMPMLFLVTGGVIGSLVRAAYFLVTKQQRRAWDHLGAVAWLLRHPILLWRARRRRAADRKHAWSILRGQLPRSRTLARLAESAAGLLSGAPAYDSGGLHHALVDEVSEDLPLPAADSAIRRAATSPGFLLCAGLTIIALVAERSLVGSVLTGSGTLSGGALVPAWGGASDLWREYLAGYHDAGLGSAASTPVTERLTLAGLGTITVKSTLHLVLQNGKWLVQWSPATIVPQLRTGDELSLRTSWPTRAAILGAGGTPLTMQGQAVTIGVEGARVKNAASVRSALVTAGATAQQASSALSAAKAHPTYFEPVFTVSRARYDVLEPTIYPVPGTVFQSSTALSAVTPGLAAGLVGTVGPVTAQELGQLDELLRGPRHHRR